MPGTAKPKRKALTSRERLRRLEQSQAQWEKDHPVEAHGMKVLSKNLESRSPHRTILLEERMYSPTVSI